MFRSKVPPGIKRRNRLRQDLCSNEEMVCDREEQFDDAQRVFQVFEYLEGGGEIIVFSIETDERDLLRKHVLAMQIICVKIVSQVPHAANEHAITGAIVEIGFGGPVE
jgi:hypothetical protein